jgi:prepilin-type N-terminal cleavage/methylation domain-containing protein
MNMMLKKRLANRRGRRGFTLVEVIVVLVILAILAAIAIPALTGYIDKAQDKEWIAKARNIVVGYRTVLNNAYSNGTLNDKHQTSLRDGNVTSSAIKIFYGSLGHSSGWETSYTSQVNELLGWDIGTWSMGVVGPYSPDSTALNADGFNVNFYSAGGIASGKASLYTGQLTVVTYRVKPITGMTLVDYQDSPDWQAANLEYDPSAGYEVYHLSN